MCDRIGYEDGKAWPTTLIAQARRWSGDDDPEIRDLLLDAPSALHRDRRDLRPDARRHVARTFTEFDPEIRAEFATEMLELGRRQGGDNTILPIALHNLAYPTWFMGEHERAWGLNRLAISAAIASGMVMNLGLALIQAATFEGTHGDPDRAAVLFGAGRAHFGMQLAPFQEVDLRPGRRGRRGLARPGAFRRAAPHRLGDERRRGGRLRPRRWAGFGSRQAAAHASRSSDDIVLTIRSSGTSRSAARLQPSGCHSSWPVAWASESIENQQP